MDDLKPGQLETEKLTLNEGFTVQELRDFIKKGIEMKYLWQASNGVHRIPFLKDYMIVEPKEIVISADEILEGFDGL